MSFFEALPPNDQSKVAAMVYYAVKVGSTKLNKNNSKQMSPEELAREFLRVYNLASQQVYKIPYMELSEQVRSAVAQYHSTGSDWRFREPDRVGPSFAQAIEAEIKKEREERIWADWYEELLSSSGLRHTLHPEDEAWIASDLQRFKQNT